MHGVHAVSTLYAVIHGMVDLLKNDALRDFQIRNKSLQWLAIVWGLHQAMPGLVFGGCEPPLCLCNHPRYITSHPVLPCVATVCVSEGLSADSLSNVQWYFWWSQLLQGVQLHPCNACVIPVSYACIAQHGCGCVCRYLLLYKTFPQVLKVYVPLLVGTIYTLILLIEGRIAYAFAVEIDCSKQDC